MSGPAGWSPDRDVPIHLARAAIVGAGRPAWPAALEVLASWSGLSADTPRGRLVVDATASSRHAGWPDDAIIGELDGQAVRVDADGGVWVGDERLGDGIDALCRVTGLR